MNTNQTAKTEGAESEIRPTSAGTKTLLSWIAPIVPIHDRSQRWYYMGGVVVAISALFALILSSWTFALVIVLLGGTYYILRHSPPVVNEIAISERGFTLEGEFMPWNDCKDFWFVHTPEYTELTIAKKAGWNRIVSIQTAGVDQEHISAVISQYLPRRADKRESILDTFIRICKL